MLVGEAWGFGGVQSRDFLMISGQDMMPLELAMGVMPEVVYLRC